MDMRLSWIGRYILILSVYVCQTGSDWLNHCAHVTSCSCKWSSGKKTATCSAASLTEIPHLSADIQILDLHGNILRELKEDAFASIGLLNLQRLNLSYNNIHFLHAHAFRELRILIELDLSQNELSQLSPEIFKGNDRLRLLVLNDNPLNGLVAEQFPPLKHLKRLELSRCRLQKIHPWAFVHLRALETVYVNQNSLTYLHQNTFNLPALKTLTLSENPWYCDCRLRKFHEWFLNMNLGSELIVCVGPENKSQLSWKNVKNKDMICPPQAIAVPSIIRTESGADISFGCFARGDPSPELSWYFHNTEVQNETYKQSEIFVHQYIIPNFDDLNEDIINKSSRWLNITINNVTQDLAGEWKCKAKTVSNEAKAYLTLVLPKTRIATTRTAPDYSTFFVIAGSILSLTSVGFMAACLCWKVRRRRVPPSRSFTDQEKKLLDSSIAVSCDRTSGSSYGFEMLDRSMSLDSEEAHRCLEPVQITIEPGAFPPPPAEFALPAPYSNIFISVKVSDYNDEYPDLLGGGATLPRRSRTCILKSDYDNMGPRITAAGSSVWSLPGANTEVTNKETDNRMPLTLSTFSTEFTAL